jgi:hypothetical protein
MVTTRLWQAAVVGALGIQAAFVVGYGWMTRWTFSAPLTSTPPPVVPDGVRHVVEAAALLQQVGLPLQVGDLPSTLLSAVLNTGAWAATLFLLLNALVWLGRLAMRRPPVGT